MKDEIRSWEDQESLQHSAFGFTSLSRLSFVTHTVSLGLQLEKELEGQSHEDLIDVQDLGSFPELSVGLPAAAVAVFSGQTQVHQL